MRANDTVAALFANAEYQRNDLRGIAIPDVVRSPRLIPKTSQAILFKALLPDVEERPGRRQRNRRSD
jgi:hypothetical protein